MSLTNPLFCVFDFETTGLTKHRAAPVNIQPRAIEFAGILTDGVDIIDEFEVMMNPGVALEEIIVKITGLTNEILDNEPTFKEAYPGIRDFIVRADYMVAHNASFDRAIMRYEAERLGLTLEDVGFVGRPICTVEEMYPQLGYRIKLADLYARLVAPYEQKHRAMDDIKLLHQVCQAAGIYRSLGGK